MGYINAPKGQNPWISEPPMPHISQRQPFAAPHTSRGNPYRSWQGDPETNAGQRLGQIAYGQAMYVSEWIQPQIDAKEARAKAKAVQAEGGGEGPSGPPSLTDQMGNRPHGGPSGGMTVQSGPPALQRANRPRYGTLRNQDGSLLALPAQASPGNQAARPVPSPLAIGPTGNPGAWGGSHDPKGIPMPPVRTDPNAFGKRLANQSRVQARNVQTEGPSLLGALPAPADRVGPSAKRRPAGMDARKRGTFQQLSTDYE